MEDLEKNIDYNENKNICLNSNRENIISTQLENDGKFDVLLNGLLNILYY